MKPTYPIRESHDTTALTQFLAKDGQLLLPMVELIQQAHVAIDDLIDVMGRATIEAILLISAQQVAGPKRQGKAKEKEGQTIGWHGTQPGRVTLKERGLRVAKPRLRRKGGGRKGEVTIPAYEAMQQDPRLGHRMLEILLAGVSTRRYETVLPDMAQTVGISKSKVSREAIRASEKLLKELTERRFDDLDLLIVYIDGIQLGDYHVIVALGVDDQGVKHVLGLREGASENTAVATGLLEDLVERGIKPDRRRLFVIDAAKALRKAIDQVYGKHHSVQRCRNHKLRNVLGHLPQDQHDQARSTLKAAWKLDAHEGMKKVEQYAS